MIAQLRCVAVIAGSIFALLPTGAGAATFTVTSTADSSDLSPGNGVCSSLLNGCTLRAAIGEANALFGTDQILVGSGTYQTSSVLTIASPMTISGPSGARSTVIDGAAGATVIDANGAGAATIRGLTVTGGQRGISVTGTDLTVDQVTISGNTYDSGSQVDGAGMVITGTGAVLLTRSAVKNNSGTSTNQDAVGGGIRVYGGGELTAESSTFSGNTIAAPGLGRASFGGGIAATSATVVLRHVTMLNNTASAGSAAYYGGNLYIQDGSSTVTDSIFSGGQASLGYENCGGPQKPTATGRNIDSGTSCGFGAGQLSSTNPLLEAFGDHGGPTDSAPPKLTSPALDRAGSCLASTTDQRGALLPAGPACDIGAAELSADIKVTVEASRSDVPAGGDVSYLVRVANDGADAAALSKLDVSITGAAELVSVLPSAGSCTTAIHCELGTIPAGSSATVTAIVRAGAAGALTATASATSSIPDPAAADNQASVQTPISGGAAVVPSPIAPAMVPPVADTTRPVLGAIKLSGKARGGRKFTLRTTLSEQATVSLKIQRLIKGRRSGKKCSSKARRGKRCRITRTAGTVNRRASQGSVRLVVPARIAKRKLAAGRYRITATATDAAGNRSKARHRTITVKRR